MAKKKKLLLLLKLPLLKRLLLKLRLRWKLLPQKLHLLKLHPPKLHLLHLLLLLPSNTGSRNEKPASWPVFFRLHFAAAARV